MNYFSSESHDGIGAEVPSGGMFTVDEVLNRARQEKATAFKRFPEIDCYLRCHAEQGFKDVSVQVVPPDCDGGHDCCITVSPVVDGGSPQTWTSEDPDEVLSAVNEFLSQQPYVFYQIVDRLEVEESARASNLVDLLLG